MPNTKTLFLIIFFIFLLCLPAASYGATSEVRIGVLAYRGKEAANTMWSDTASFLTKKIPHHVFTIVPLDFHEIGPAVRRGKVDFVIANPEIYVDLEATYGVTRIATLKNKTESGPYKIFGGVIFIRADRTDIKDLKDLKGKRFMAVEETSLGGWTMAWREFKAQGINPYNDFAELSFGGTHDAVAYAVRNGTVDAGTVRTDALERMRDEGKIDMAHFRILNARKVRNFPFALSTRLYPEWPFAKVRHTQDELAQSVVIALMNMRKDDPAAISAKIEGWTIPLDYQPVHELMKELNLGLYKDYGKVTLASAIRQHRYWFMVGLLLLFLMSVVTVYVVRLNRRLSERTSELITAKEAAESANRAKSVFLTNMSHEFRTPLNAVLGFSRLMKTSSGAAPEQRESLNIITRSAEHLLNLINNVLDISKIEAGRVELEETDVDLHQLMHELQSLMYVQANEKGLNFSVVPFPDLPRYLTVDAGKLRQVLINLIGNAIKYTEAGGVALRAGVVKQEQPRKTRVWFEIEDSGPGISQEDRERIFFPFVRLGDRPPAAGGSGLGLAICKQYVELMGGRINVDSEPDKGSLFRFEVPVEIPVMREIAAVPPQVGVTGLAGEHPRYRILIVEDQAENRLLLHKLLEPLGFDLREAVNGQEAVELFERWRPHLIWMDIRMPVMDGLEATRRIKAARKGPVAKIIAITAHALEEERREILGAGCDDLVRKPYRETEIFEVMARHLGLKYKYEGERNPQELVGAVLPEQVSALPANLRTELYQAVVELDTVRTLALIEKVGEHDRATGNSLEALAKRLDYDRLLRLLESAVASPAGDAA